MSKEDSIVQLDTSGFDTPEVKDGEGDIDNDIDEMSEDEKKQFEAHKLASMCYCEKLNSKDDEDEEEIDKLEKVKFADTVVVCPTYTSQVSNHNTRRHSCHSFSFYFFLFLCLMFPVCCFLHFYFLFLVLFFSNQTEG